MSEKKRRLLLATQLILVAAPLSILFLYGGSLTLAVAVAGLTEWGAATSVGQVLLVIVCLVAFWVLSVRFLIGGGAALSRSNGFLWAFAIIGVIYSLIGAIFLAAFYVGSSIADVLAFFRLGAFGLPLVPAVLQLLWEERQENLG